MLINGKEYFEFIFCGEREISFEWQEYHKQEDFSILRLT